MSQEEDQQGAPSYKKARLDEADGGGGGSGFATFRTVQTLLLFDEHANEQDSSKLSVPQSNDDLHNQRQLLERIRQDWNKSGFRTSLVLSPLPGISIYKPNCSEAVDDKNDECETTTAKKQVQLIILGLHPEQVTLEKIFVSDIKETYCLMLYCRRLKELFQPMTTTHNEINDKEDSIHCLCQILENHIAGCRSSLENAKKTSSIPPVRLSEIQQLALSASESKGRQLVRKDQLEREWDHIMLCQNATLSNALLQNWLLRHQCSLSDVVFKPCPKAAQFERFTFYCTSATRTKTSSKPGAFSLMPSAHVAVSRGMDYLIQQMTDSFWDNLLTMGYFGSQEFKRAVEPCLSRYFRSGIADIPAGGHGADENAPFSLQSRFTPSYPLSLYLWGEAGVGKTSFARLFGPALKSTLEEHVDPQIAVSHVKQNLNKPLSVLELELSIRPNNNDLSIMSIVQGRRQPLHQARPGLVILGLEEMAAATLNETALSEQCQQSKDPDQIEICQLLRQRFAGRKGSYHSKPDETRNGGRTGLSGDASIAVIFTSNYPYAGDRALRELDMFSNLQCIEMKPILEQERVSFARSYIFHCLNQRLVEETAVNKAIAPHQVQLEIPLGEGDLRLLVKQLRMLAFHTQSLLNELQNNKKEDRLSVSISIQQKELDCEIKVGPHIRILRLAAGLYLPRNELRIMHSDSLLAANVLPNSMSSLKSDLTSIMEYWLGHVVAPVVVVSTCPAMVKSIVRAASRPTYVQSISNVDADEYKMIRSLYDEQDIPNLRDDILEAKQKEPGYVVVELLCKSKEAQMHIREMIEDTPSMAAFSTVTSSLQKSGLFFAVYVQDDITPEIKSRATYVC